MIPPRSWRFGEKAEDQSLMYDEFVSDILSFVYFS